MVTHGGLSRLTVYLEPGLAARVAERAKTGRRSVSAELSLLVEASLRMRDEPFPPLSEPELPGELRAGETRPSGSESVLGEGGPRAERAPVSPPGPSEAASPSPSPPRKPDPLVVKSAAGCDMFVPRGTRCKSCGKVHS